MDAERYYKKITESLKLLSLPFDKQVQYFPEFVDAPFEVLDTFYHAFILLPELVELRKFNYDVIANMLRLYNLIELTSHNPNFKNLEEKEFSKSDAWNKVRELSKETLQLMNEPIENPNPRYI